MGDTVNPKITKLVMQQYETVRKMGEVNMRDMMAVYARAIHAGCFELAELVLDTIQHPNESGRPYLEIIKRYAFYIKKYRI